MENQVEEVKKRIDIVEFIASYIPLKKLGRNFKTVCPFHQEKTPSFIVSPERQMWRCFGACQEGGDVISFLMKWENITFYEALKDLADKAGIRLKQTNFEDKIWNKKERLISLNYLTSQYYQYILHNTSFGKKASDYLLKRGIRIEIAKKFQLGYALNSWDSLFHYLKKKKYTNEEILDAGLIIRGNHGNLYDRFRGRLVFPIKDARGNIIGFSGRSIDSETKEAKYINTPETVLYHKRETLYGLDMAKEAIKREKKAILVEGEFDVISPYQVGIENIVAIKGSAVTREQLILLKRYAERIILALDTDLAGEEAMKRGIEEAENMEFEISIVTFDFAKDPDEASHKDVDKFKNSIKKSTPLYDFIINLSLKKNSSDDPFGKKRIAEETIPFIDRIRNPIIRSHYIKKLTEILKVDERSIYLLIKDYNNKKRKKTQFQPVSNKIKKDDRGILLEKYLLSTLFQDKNPLEFSKIIFSVLNIDDFSIPSYKKIINLLLNFKVKNEKFDLNEFIEKLPKELQSALDEIYLFASMDLEFAAESLKKLLYEVKKESLKRKISNLLLNENNSDKSQNKNITDLTLALNEVEKKLLTL